MKTSILFIAAIITITLSGCIGCKKEITDPNGLPLATQEGKNTLGFLLNGQLWTPKGFNGTANLDIDVDFRISSGGFGIGAYRIISSDNRDYFGIGIKDSLNFISVPITLPMGTNSIANAMFSNYDCSTDFFDNNTFRRGNLTITKLDKTNRIIAGTFNVVLFKSGSCIDTIKITDGRFDMKF